MKLLPAGAGVLTIPATYGIDSIKGCFPHHFNTPENQDYVGPRPKPEMFGVATMHGDELNDEFLQGGRRGAE